MEVEHDVARRRAVMLHSLKEVVDSSGDAALGSSGDSKWCCLTGGAGIRPFGANSAPFVVEQQLNLCYKTRLLMLDGFSYL